MRGCSPFLRRGLRLVPGLGLVAVTGVWCGNVKAERCSRAMRQDTAILLQADQSLLWDFHDFCQLFDADSDGESTSPSDISSHHSKGTKPEVMEVFDGFRHRSFDAAGRPQSHRQSTGRDQSFVEALGTDLLRPGV